MARVDPQDGAVTRSPQPPPSGGQAASKLSILLVDDHEDSLWAMSRLLQKLEYRVVTANCVRDALNAANAEQFDLLISDVGLPDGTGLQLMQELTSRGAIRGIALTGYGSDADIQRTLDEGFISHLTKPVNFLALEDAIRRAVSGPPSGSGG